MRIHHKEGGFTIVELMIATVVFSVVLLLCATAIIQVGRMYYKGIIISRTEDVSRKVINDMSQAIQFGSTSYKGGNFIQVLPGFSSTNAVSAICIGSLRYTFMRPDFRLGNDAGASKHVLWKDSIGDNEPCSLDGINMSIDKPSNDPNGQELLSTDMRVIKLLPEREGSLWKVHVTIAYGSSLDLFTVTEWDQPNGLSQCISAVAGGQFCAISALNTRVVKRL